LFKSTLIEAAWAATRCKGSYYGALYRRLKSRRGPKRAIVAVAHAMLHALWHMLSRKSEHRDLGDTSPNSASPSPSRKPPDWRADPGF
jgi:transposase